MTGKDRKDGRKKGRSIQKILNSLLSSQPTDSLIAFFFQYTYVLTSSLLLGFFDLDIHREEPTERRRDVRTRG